MEHDSATMEGTHLSDLQLSPLGRFENVLLATDGSEYSAGAERIAISLCANHRGHLHILAAIPRPGGSGWMGGQPYKDATASSEENLIRIQEIAKESGVDCTTHIRSGEDPYEVIVEASKELVADVVVMGRRGRRGLARIMLGDATAKVIGYAPCSVLVVPEDAQPWTSVLVATDGSRFGDYGAVTAASLAKDGDITVNVLSVKVPMHSERRQAEAQPIVDRVLKFLSDQGVQGRGLVQEGPADEVIVEVAEDRSAGLIILGNFGRTGIGRMLFGSKAERVINATKSAVLIVRGG